MPLILDLASWDAIENTAGDVVIVIPPVPQPRGVLIAVDAVYVFTDGHGLRLMSSSALRDRIAKARSLIVAEAHEHIVRETLLQVAVTEAHLAGDRPDEYQLT